MSGLGAIFFLNGSSANSSDVDRMRNSLRLHGSVKQNSTIHQSCGLVWAQSGSFTPQDANERQPISAGARYHMVFVGFLYDRDELAAQLGIGAEMAGKLSDGSLVHAAWQKWQSEALQYIYGEYSVVVFDQDQATLTAARSPMAALPIFYHQSAKRLTLASAPKGIFAVGDIERKLNDHKLADSLALNFESVHECFFEGISSLPLGHQLLCSKGKVEVSQYYDIRSAPEVRFSNDEDYVEAANEIFSRAVGDAMRSTSVPACMLSAGLDSSAVVVETLATMQRAGDHSRLNTFTSVPDQNWDGRVYGHGRIGDESGPVKAMAEMYPKIQPHFLSCEELPIDNDHDKILLLAEAPQRNASALYWIVEMLRLARQSGHNVMLGGQSGNASLSFSGKARYAKMLRHGQILELIGEIRAIKSPFARTRLFYSLAIAPNLPNSVFRKAQQLRHGADAHSWNNFSAANPTYMQDLRVSERMAEMDWDDSYQGFSNPHDMMSMMLSRGGRDQGQSTRCAIETITGVQMRDPLGSRKLVEFCAGLPDDQFLKNGQDRRLIRRMMADRFPPEILKSARGRQGADWHARMTADLPRYKAEIERMSDDPEMAKRFDMPRLRKLVDTWPDVTPLSKKDHPDATLARSGLLRAISAARFINSVSGKN